MGIEDKLVEGIYRAANLLLSKLVKPDVELSDVTALTEEKIDELISRFGIKGIILDIDDTMRKNMKSIPKCNQEWLSMISSRLKVIVVSNGTDKDIESYLKTQGIDYIGFAYKPLKANFKKACKKLDLKPEEILVIGDQLFEDIHGGKRNNMRTAIVKNVKEDREDD